MNDFSQILVNGFLILLPIAILAGLVYLVICIIRNGRRSAQKKQTNINEYIRKEQEHRSKQNLLEHCHVVCRSADQAILIDPGSGELYQAAVIGSNSTRLDFETLEVITYDHFSAFMSALHLPHAAIAYSGMNRVNYPEYQLFYTKYDVDTYWKSGTPLWEDETLAQSFKIHTNYGSELRFHQISGMWFAEVIWHRSGRWMLRLEDDFFLRKDVDETIEVIHALIEQRTKHPENHMEIDRADLGAFLRAVQTGRMPPNDIFPKEFFGNMLLVFYQCGRVVMDEFTGQLYHAAEETVAEMNYSELQEILEKYAPEEWHEKLKGLSENNYEHYKQYLFGTYGVEKQTFPLQVEPFIDAVSRASHGTEPWFVSRLENGNWKLCRLEDYCHGGSCYEYTCTVPTSYFAGKSVNDMLYNDLNWQSQS